MFLSSVLSYLGAWSKLINDFPIEHSDIQKAIEDLPVPKTKIEANKRIDRKFYYSLKEMNAKLTTNFERFGWHTNDPQNILKISNERLSRVDAIKGGVGIEYLFGKFAFVESNIFVKFPLFIRANQFQIAFVVTPTKSLAKSLALGVSSFEMIRDRLKALQPLPLKYPFAILGISDHPDRVTIEELTTELDQFLIEVTGYSLLEMKVQSETKNHEFKKQLPDNDNFAKEICAFANNPKGGIILVGIEDNGSICGIPNSELDSTQLRILQIAQSRCIPSPQVECSVFNVPENPENSILVVQVTELERKPCMTKEKVYIRSGASARPAGPDEIRRLLLGKGS